MQSSRSRFGGAAVEQVRVAVLAGALGVGLSTTAAAQQPAAAPAQQPAGAAAAPAEVTFYGNPSSPISSGVVIPGGRASIRISGTVPPVIKADAPPGSRERFGDTKTQAAGVLKSIESQLALRGLSMRDVVYLRAYLIPDPAKDNKIDVAGWNAAYGEAFNTPGNPTRTARSTVGVAALVNPDWLIEIEAFAVFPLESRDAPLDHAADSKTRARNGAVRLSGLATPRRASPPRRRGRPLRRRRGRCR